MKISKLDQHCGNCSLIELCGEPFYYCLCGDSRFEDMDEEEYKEFAEKIDWAGFVPHDPCKDCDKDCEGCEEESENNDCRVSYIAYKVAEMLKKER
jgi:hypothetical protein